MQAAPQVVGEHTHHHVHETVQPVIHKETIEPEVVHTTIPIHEKHIAPSEHHGMSQLPMKSMDEVKSMGLNLGSGGQHTQEEYEGHPRPYSADLQKERAPADIEPRKHDGDHDPDTTGHKEWLSGIGGKPLAGSSATGSSTDRGFEGAGGLGGVAAGGTTSAAVDRLSNDHHMDRNIGNPTSGVTGSSATGTSEGLDRNAGTANTPGHAGLAGVAGAGAVAGAAGSGLSDRTPAHNTTTSNTSNPGTMTSAHDELSRLPGHRRTASGAYTNADPNPSYTKTAAGHLTGVDGRHGPEDSSSTSRAVEGVAAGSAASAATQRGSESVRDQEPRSTEGGRAEDSTKRDIGGDDVQHASKQGQDPSLETAKGGKLTGTGQDGSHSAVFGLTPGKLS